jgi:RES domain-containing protein
LPKWKFFGLADNGLQKSLSGKGAAKMGARWNSEGVELIYTAANRSLAMAEVAVHLSYTALPTDFVMLTIFIPDDVSSKKLVSKDLPSDWNDFPYYSASTQTIGDRFIDENKDCLLVVPSVVTQGDHNILINPGHPDFKRIKIVQAEKFPFDRRMFK